MIYTSTRDKSIGVSASEAIAKGISSEGGLFVPTEIPTLSLDDIKNSTYKELGYLKNAREEIRKRKAHSGEGVANAFSKILS